MQFVLSHLKVPKIRVQRKKGSYFELIFGSLSSVGAAGFVQLRPSGRQKTVQKVGASWNFHREVAVVVLAAIIILSTAHISDYQDGSFTTYRSLLQCWGHKWLNQVVNVWEELDDWCASG